MTVGDMIKVNLATCSFCFERQRIPESTPGVQVRCSKCGELFRVVDPRFTGRRGAIRRFLGLSGIAAGAAFVVLSLWGLGKGIGAEGPEFRLVSARSSPPSVALPVISNPRLGYELSVPAGWDPEAPSDEEAFQFTLVNRSIGAKLSLAVETVEPEADLGYLRKASQEAGGDLRMLLARISGQPLEIDSYEIAGTGGSEQVEFDFRLAGSDGTGSGLVRRGFLLLRGGRWFWFYLSSGTSGMPSAHAQAKGILRTFSDTPAAG